MAKLEFGNPVIFCNEHTLPFLFSNKSVLLEKSPKDLGQEQQNALQRAIEEELRDKSANATKVKRQPTKGKHAKAIIIGVTGAVCVITLTTLLAVPGGIGFILGSLGLLAADGAITTGLTAATVVAVAGIAGVTSAGATSTVYFTARAVIPRKLLQVTLDHAILAQDALVMKAEQELAAAVALPLPASPPLSPRFFSQGKEEMDADETTSNNNLLRKAKDNM